jgi:hypothetical protein
MAMAQEVPRWIGLVGMVLVLALCGFALAGQVLLTLLLMIASVALVVLENRCERGPIAARRGSHAAPFPRFCLRSGLRGGGAGYCGRQNDNSLRLGKS